MNFVVLLLGFLTLSISKASAQLPLPECGCEGFCVSDLNISEADVKAVNIERFLKSFNFTLISLTQTEGVWFLYQAAPYFFLKDSKCTYINITATEGMTQIYDIHQVSLR